MRMTTRDLGKMKSDGERIAMVTAYDFTTAGILDRAGIPIMLVGDSLGNVMLGYGSTIPVTMDDMIRHASAVVRGSENAHVVVDMPFMSYQADDSEAVRNAGRLLQEAGVQSVKLEGGRDVAETVRRIVRAGIPVMGHIGLTPQALNRFGGYRVQGRSAKVAAGLLEDARALEEAGVYSMVMELVPSQLAALITDRVSVPTIGIGAGSGCDGQVLVFHDLMGLSGDFKHARRYAELADVIGDAAKRYVADVQAGSFPSEAESFTMEQDVLDEITGPSAKSV